MKAFLSRLSRLLVLPLVAFLLAWFIILFSRFVAPDGGVTGSDFLWFYAVGQVGREECLGRVYDLDLAAEAQAKILGTAPGDQQILIPNHPPFLFPILTLISSFDFKQAYFLNSLLMYLLVICGMVPLLVFIKKREWNTPELLLLTISILLFEPLVMSVLKGQDSALLLLGGLLWLMGFLRQDNRLAGLGLSLTLIRPHLALILAVPFLFQRRKIWWWFCAGAVTLGLYSFLQLGITGTIQYLQILSLSSAGGGYGITQAAMVNFTGLLVRLFPSLALNISLLLGWSLYGISLVTLCLLWRFSRSLNLAHISLAVCLALFTSPHLHYHDLALLLVPLIALAVIVFRSGRGKSNWAALLPLLISFLLVLGELWVPAGFLVVYLLLFLLPIPAFLLTRLKTSPVPSQPT